MTTTEATDKRFVMFASLLAALVAAFVLYLVYFRARKDQAHLWNRR